MYISRTRINFIIPRFIFNKGKNGVDKIGLIEKLVKMLNYELNTGRGQK
ncbi:hypothetical protein METHB2_50105 [Candidatus Methylobacter favarea]|uniref:Uncharacterized protein n=1 Tax=Candidatus Methylobacter favarea TaxID=2707345 RepID=A0A8S0X946_9GAMM|nr:hypothetical protein METHB2_50105 [Candidatus Methylobacter favarea]